MTRSPRPASDTRSHRTFADRLRSPLGARAGRSTPTHPTPQPHEVLRTQPAPFA